MSLREDRAKSLMGLGDQPDTGEWVVTLDGDLGVYLGPPGYRPGRQVVVTYREDTGWMPLCITTPGVLPIARCDVSTRNGEPRPDGPPQQVKVAHVSCQHLARLDDEWSCPVDHDVSAADCGMTHELVIPGWR